MRSTQWIILAGFLVSCATTKSPVSVDEKDVSFELADTSGAMVRTADHVGRVVLVDFWATWCKPCEASFPFYDSLAKQYGDDGFVVLAVSVDEDDEAVKSFLARKPVAFTVLRDPTGSVPERFDLQTMPTAVLLGRDGKVKHIHEGFRPGDEDKIKKLVEEALAESAPEPADRPRT